MLEGYRVGEMQHHEGAVGHAGFTEMRVRFGGEVLVIQLLHPAFVRTFGHLRVTETKGVRGTRRALEGREKRPN